MLKKIIKKIIPEKYHKDIYKSIIHPFEDYSEKFYSQEGEDMILRNYVHDIKTGFYVDVGAHHPKRFSNTYYYYKKGWKGINIDAMPGSMELFKKKRPRDINLEVAISDKKEMLTYCAFSEPALNSFSNEWPLGLNKKKNYKIIFKKKIKTKTLADVLDKYLPVGQNIDFITIDVEGLDLQVLKSNNWKKYRPNYILVEMLGNNWKDILDSEIHKFLYKKGYEVVAKTRDTALFKFINSLS